MFVFFTEFIDFTENYCAKYKRLLVDTQKLSFIKFPHNLVVPLIIDFSSSFISKKNLKKQKNIDIKMIR